LNFDLDHTIARYNQQELSKLMVDSFCSYVVNHEGYPPFLFEKARNFRPPFPSNSTVNEKLGLDDAGTAAQYDLEFSCKGILFDKKLGNFLIIDEHKKVLKAFHGSKPLHFSQELSDEQNQQQQKEGSKDDQEVEEEEKALKTATIIYSGPLHEFVAQPQEYSPKERFHCFVTGFDYPIVQLISAMIDLVDAGHNPESKGKKRATPSDGSSKKGKNSKKIKMGIEEEDEQNTQEEENENSTEEPIQEPKTKYEKVFTQMIRGFAHNFTHFSKQGGYFYPKFLNNISRFVYKRPHVRAWLGDLRRQGIPVFLISNSDYGFCNLVLVEAFGPGWEQDFDLVVTSAKKPTFFSGSNPFNHVDKTTYTETTKAEKIEFGNVYTQGNAKALEAFVRSKMAERNDPITNRKFVYFGDNLLTDVLAVRHFMDWIPVAIVEEMEQHVIPEKIVSSINFLQNQEGTANGNGSTIGHNHHLIKKTSASSHWGSFLFHEDGGITYWNRLIMKESALAVSDVANLINISLDHQFHYKLDSDICYFPALV